MSHYDLIIRNGIVVTPEGQAALDVAVQAETIAAIGPALPGVADETLDAAGSYVFPGFIDPHVHLSLPVGRGLVSSDDFGSGTAAAACGGVTTIIDFTTQPRGVSLAQAVGERRMEADPQVAIDYALHLTIMDDSPGTLAEIRRLAGSGYPSLKLYMTYESLMVGDEAILRIMDAAGECGALTLVHAENHTLVAFLKARLLSQGQTGPAAHPLSRPAWVEGEATGRAITMARATGASLYVVHVSCGESLAPIAEARERGQAVYGETCPHYVLLSEEEYERPGFEGAKYVMTPPLRQRGNWPLLWDALADGNLDVVATDHCPWRFDSQKIAGRDRFDLIPGGIGGVETRAQLMFSEGVLKGRLSLERFVEVMSTGPARIFGLAPRKGSVAVGADADLVVFDPRPVGLLRNADLHQRVDYTVFEGWKVQGKIVATISRGMVVARNGAFTGRAGHGRFVERNL